MNISFEVKDINVMLTNSTDIVTLTLDMPTPFPTAKYEGHISIQTEADYGVAWCKSVLGITPEITNIRTKL